MQSNFWAGSKNCGQAQNILEPVKGQGKRILEVHSKPTYLVFIDEILHVFPKEPVN